MPDLKFITTDTNSGYPEYLDFATLRKLGIQHIADLSGKIWTDHNLHDPGITMLEALCYVLTDLDYRTKLGFKDLIAVPAGASEDNFYTAAKILGNNPLTITDIRRMLIDIKGVRNAWIELPAKDEYALAYNCDTGELLNAPLTEELIPVPLKGLYKVLIEPDDVYAAAYEKDACGNDVFPLDTVLADIDERLHAHRNLCEDFAEVVVMEKEPVSFCIHIELAANFNPDDVLVNIYSSIQDFFSPAPVFYSLQQLLDKGRSMEEIFEGRPYDFKNQEPLQQNGFIDAQELESLERLTEIHASDLYRIIMGVPGVVGITRLVMTSFDEEGYPLVDINGNPIEQEGEEWCLKLKKDHRPVLAPASSNVIFFRNKIPFTANQELVLQRYIKSISDYNKFPRQPAELDGVIPKGRQLDLAQYTSVQYEFPKLYMVGKNEVPADQTAARKAQALQLQGYLLFYDRLLADYFAQLANIRQLFSLGQDASSHTYFSADISSIPQLPSLLRYERKLPGDYYNGMPLAFEPGNDGVSRKEYNTMFRRDEMIRRIISECSNNNIKYEIKQVESTDNWYLLITDTAGDVLLRTTIYFSTPLEAEQAARDISFLATLPDSYSRYNNRTSELFSFDLVYNTAGNTEMLTALYETTAQYQERKDRFQNHLLARFSEDFTDYALMMYNLSGKKNDPQSNIEDKAAFLSAYPETSANRALAFDYKHPGAGLPVYGLQKRVAGLMGIRSEPAASLNNFDLVTAIKQTGFVVKVPEQNTPLFVSESLHDNADIQEVFNSFLSLGKNKSNYKAYGCSGEGVFGFYIQSPLNAPEWINAKFSAEYTTAVERDAVIDWMVKFFEDDGEYKVYPQTQEGYYYLLPDDYGKTLLKSKTGYPSAEEAMAAGYNCLEILQDDNNWMIVPDVTNFRIVVLTEAYYPITFGTSAAASIKMQELQKYFHKHNLTYQDEHTELYNWQMTDAGQPAWQGVAPFKSTGQLPAAFIQFIELAAKAENYRITGQYNLEVIRSEADVDGKDTVMAMHLSLYTSQEAAQQGISYYASLFSQLWLTGTSTVNGVPAAIYYLNDSQASGTRLLTTVPVPDGPGVAAFTRSIVRYATDAQRLTLVPAMGCRYIVQLRNENGQLLAESPEAADHTAAVNLMERILVKAGQDALWIEKGTSAEAYGFVWEELLQSIAIWDTQQAAASVFLNWILEAGQPDIDPEYKSAYGYGYTLFSAAKLPIAKQAKWYDTEAERDAAIAEIRQHIAALQGNAGWSSVNLNHYYFKIREDGGFLLLEEPGYYNSYPEVRTAFYDTIKFGKQRQYYKLTTQENCTYGFHIMDEADHVLAIHPARYTSAVARDVVVERTLRFLQERGQVVTNVKMAGAWRYNWEWLSCCCWFPEIALEGLEEKPEESEAKAALLHILQVLAPDKKNYKTIQEENGLRLYLLEGETKMAVYPHWFESECAAEEIRDRLITWLGYSLGKLKNYPVTKDVRTDLYQSGSGDTTIGYRLWDREFRIARYTILFDTAEKRVTALAQLLQRYHRKLPSYTVLEKGNSVVVMENGQYYFQLRRNDLLLWQSVTAYGDAAAAAVAFSEHCWYILQLSLNKGNYSHNNTSLFLNDTNGQPIAVYNGISGNYEPAIHARQLFALKHGIYQTVDNTYAFHIYNTTAGVYEWESTHTYTTADDAETALLEFIQLLLFRGNYCLDNETVGCYYAINLGKVLLDIQRVTEKCEEDKDEVSETDAWERLQAFLDKQEPGNENFFPYTNYAAGCRYAFRMVDSSVYRIAQHTGWYQGMEKRETVRMELLADIFCKKRLYGWFVNPDAVAITAEHILECYFPHPEAINAEALWMSYDDIPLFDKLWEPATEQLLHYYQLKDKAKNVIWNTVTRYSSAEMATAAEQYFYIYLLEMARSPASYYYEPQVGCDNAFTLSLKDMDGKIIAVAPGIICKEDIERDRATRMFNAMMFPIIESGQGYKFEINNVLQSTEKEYDYATIWESEQVYNTPEEARAGLRNACDLLLLLDNYQRGDENACGPYGITLVDPAGILADHPLTYTGITARNAAIEKVQAAISAEGFHMLEHILLRPRSKQQSYEVLQLTLNWGGDTGRAGKVTVTSETVFADAAAFLGALENATGMYEDKEVISWWRDDEKIASAVVTDNAAGFMLNIADVLSRASVEDITTLQIPLSCDDTGAVLSICSDTCICCDEEEEIDEDNKVYCDRTFLADPYSFWATVVLPAWPQRFRLARFRQFFEDTLRREAPAHIRLNIVWIGPQQMLQFEQAWQLWLAALSRNESCDYNTSLEKLNTVLLALKNVYPAAYLYDDEGGDDKPLIILDEAMLG